MERFNILEGGFFAFVMAKRRPAAFAWLVVTSAVLLAAMFGGMSRLTFYLSDLAYESGNTDVVMTQLAMMPVLIIGFLLFYLVFYAGWWRFLTGRKLPALIPFRIGADEGRILVIMLVHIVLMLMAYLIIAIPFGIVMVLVTASAASAGPEAFMSPQFFIGIGLFYAVIFVLALAFSVKLVPGYPMAIIERRIVLFDAWSATKGVFWKALAATLIPTSVILGLEVVYLVLFWWPQFQAAMSGVYVEPPAFYEALSQPAGIAALLVIGSLIYVVLIAFALGPFAYIAVRHSGWANDEPTARDEPLAPLRPLSTTQTTS
jgi:hypothetical protein